MDLGYRLRIRIVIYCGTPKWGMRCLMVEIALGQHMHVLAFLNNFGGLMSVDKLFP
jgi:hypothetical protein